MAKQRGPVASTFTGRVGNVVGAKSKGGEYITRGYQPQVKNPNTLRQQVSRMKLSVASALAAQFAEAINIGYAKASAGTKMYPRNMFVKNIVPVDANVLNYNNGSVAVSYDKLKLSAPIGIATAPVLSKNEQAAGFVVKIEVDNINNYSLGAGEQLGLVVVGYSNTTGANLTKMGLASEGVGFTDEDFGLVTMNAFKAFLKVIPAAVNGVPTTDIPWKYPSATSATVEII